MGTLTLPRSGLVYLDANPVIYTVEKHPVYGPLLVVTASDSWGGAVHAYFAKTPWAISVTCWKQKGYVFTVFLHGVGFLCENPQGS